MLNLLPVLSYSALLVMAEADGALDKARKHKKRQLQDTLNLVLKKRKVTSCYAIFFIVAYLAAFIFSHALLVNGIPSDASSIMLTTVN